MQSDKVKISRGQMFVVLILTRIMHTMIFHAAGFKIGTPIMLTLLFTTLIEIVAAVPVIILFRGGGKDVAGEIAGESRAAVVIRLIYSGYFLFIAAGTLMNFAEFMHTEFKRVVSPLLVIVIIALAAAYCAYLGIESLARAGTVVFWAFLVLFITMAAVSEGEFDVLNLLSVTKNDIPRMIDYALRDLSSSWWLPMLCSLGEYLRDGVKTTVFGYLLSKLLLIETLLLLVTLVLWTFSDVLGYPMLALGAYAKTDFIQNFDAINMFVWSLNCVIVNGTYLFAAVQAFGKKRRGLYCLISAVIVIITAEAYELYFSVNDVLTFAVKITGIAVLGVIAPIAALAARKCRARRAKKKKFAAAFKERGENYAG